MTAVAPPGRAAMPRRDFAIATDRHQSLTIIAVILVIAVVLPQVALLPASARFGTQKDFVGGFADAGVFVLLAIGLNVVVGLAGLLDLGYAAFFAIGAYTYAFGASDFTGLHIPFWFMLPVGALVAVVFGVLLGAPTLRLRGDYLAIVTLGFGEIVPVVFLNSDTYTNGTNGITALAQPEPLRPVRHLRLRLHRSVALLATILALIAIALVLLYRAAGFAPRARLGGAPRGRAGGGQHGHQHGHDQAARVRHRASTAGLAGVFFASKLSLGQPRPVRVHRLVHRPRHGGARRHGQHLGRGGRRVHHLRAPEQGLKQLNSSSRPWASRASRSVRSTWTSRSSTS